MSVKKFFNCLFGYSSSYISIIHSSSVRASHESLDMRRNEKKNNYMSERRRKRNGTKMAKYKKIHFTFAYKF